MENVNTATPLFRVYGVETTHEEQRTMKRRDFLKTILLGGILALFGKKVNAAKKQEHKLKEAMFWKRLD
jgi:hypothetical protein